MPERTGTVQLKPRPSPTTVVSGPCGIANESPPGITPWNCVALCTSSLGSAQEALRGMGGETYPTTGMLALSGFHQMRVVAHCTSWLFGTTLKSKSGCTFVDASKQLESLLDCTVAATLVPPEPKPVESLTYGERVLALVVCAGILW